MLSSSSFGCEVQPRARRCNAQYGASMAADFKATLFFQDLASSYGWSENYFYKQAADHDAVVTKVQIMLVLRLAVLTDLHQCVAARVSDVSVPNDSKLVSGLPLPGDVASTGSTIVQPWSALLTRNESTAFYRGRFFLHGVHEHTFLANRSYDPANAESADWIAFFLDIKDNCALRHIVAPPVVLYDNFTNIFPLRMVERKVGRPFNLLHGRRPTTT